MLHGIAISWSPTKSAGAAATLGGSVADGKRKMSSASRVHRLHHPRVDPPAQGQHIRPQHTLQRKLRRFGQGPDPGGGNLQRRRGKQPCASGNGLGQPFSGPEVHGSARRHVMFGPADAHLKVSRLWRDDGQPVSLAKRWRGRKT
ncbi:hypothetical protein [Paracoccus sp. (in: a-proteobacteria)]|uniref:hypothetical protein n=1 Tax=Paracoccus sp. TaxID=267 RepID=UPI0035AEC869